MAWLALALSLPAQATALTLTGLSGLDLGTATATDPSNGDVSLGPLVIQARFGIRPEAGGQHFSGAMPLVIGQALIVRDGRLAEYRLQVVAATPERRMIEVEALVPRQAPPSRQLSGVFRTTTLKVNGVKGASPPQELKLRADGRFRMGRASGAWSFARSGTKVALEGFYAQWGHGTLSPDGQHLTFQYARGPLRYEQVMTLQVEALATR